MNDHVQQVIEDIQQYGWHVVLVMAEGDLPAFGYTIGLYHSYGHPEIILVGLERETIHKILNTIGGDVKQGGTFEAHTESDAVLKGYRVAFRPMAKQWYYEYLGVAINYYEGVEFPVLQCVWPDRLKHYPWDAASQTGFRQVQPVLDDALVANKPVTIHFFQYETRPMPDSEINVGIGGAYVNCWIRADSGVEAAYAAEQVVHDNAFVITEVIEARVVTRSFYRDNELGVEHFDEAVREGQCIVIYEWPVGAEDDEMDDDKTDGGM